MNIQLIEILKQYQEIQYCLWATFMFNEVSEVSQDALEQWVRLNNHIATMLTAEGKARLDAEILQYWMNVRINHSDVLHAWLEDIIDGAINKLTLVQQMEKSKHKKCCG